MVDSTEVDNPFASPQCESLDRFPISTSVPLSAYFYSLTVFVIGMFASFFTMWVVALPLHSLGVSPVYVFVLIVAVSILGGLHAATKMYNRLAELHRKKVDWQIDLAERMGEINLRG
jgi:hypothetical protein